MVYEVLQIACHILNCNLLGLLCRLYHANMNRIYHDNFFSQLINGISSTSIKKMYNYDTLPINLMRMDIW